MSSQTTNEEWARLAWEAEVRTLQDTIVALPPHDPERQIAERVLRDKFAERFGTKPTVSGGGAVANSKTGATTFTVQTSAGLKVSPSLMPPPRTGKKR